MSISHIHIMGMLHDNSINNVVFFFCFVSDLKIGYYNNY